MKTVLLVTTYFAPDNTIAAIRTTKMVKYMIRNGYSVDVVAVNNSNLSKDDILAKDVVGVNIKRVENTARYFRIEKIVHKLFDSIKERKFCDLSNRMRLNSKSGKIEFYPFETAHPWIGSIYYGLAMYREYDLYCGIKNQIKKADKYDFLITSYGDEFCYYYGKRYKKIHPDTRWIFDIRDAIYRYKFIPGPLSFIPLHIEHVAWERADVIVGVSKGICMRVDAEKQDKVYLVTNGYDKGDRNRSNNRLTNDKLIFTFTGSMYGGTRDLSVFFKAIRELIDKGQIDQGKIQIEFAGTKSASDIFTSQASKFGVDSLITNHGKVSREVAMELQDNADVLLAPSYDYENGNGGVITGKIFEYMTAEKNVIAVIVGDIQHSELAEIVRKTNIGFAYEESHDETDYPQLCEYLCAVYQEKMETGNICYSPNRDELEKFDYRYLSNRFIRIMDPAYEASRED